MIPPQIKYAVMALGFIAYSLSLFFWAQHIEANAWRVKVSEQKIEAGKVLATALQNNRVKENKDAENARNIDEMYQTMLADAYAGRDDFAERLRIARRGASCPNPGSTEATNPSKPQDPSGSGDVGLGQAPAVDPLLQARDGVKALVAFAKGCHARLLEVGR